MNMDDLAALAAEKAQQRQQQNQDFQNAEDSPELKTPTAEEMTVPQQQKVGVSLAGCSRVEEVGELIMKRKESFCFVLKDSIFLFFLK